MTNSNDSSPVNRNEAAHPPHGTPNIRWRPPPPSLAAAVPVASTDPSAANSTEEDEAYKVGWGNPPLEYQFPPGQSGNPKGRPKGARGLNTIVREQMTATVPVRTGRGVKRKIRAEALVMKMIELGGKGDKRAIEFLLRHYAEAVGDEPRGAGTGGAGSVEPTATDAAILKRLRQQYRDELGRERDAGGEGAPHDAA